MRYLAGSAAIFFCVFALLRAVFYFGFSEIGHTHYSLATLIETLSIGFRFDLRLALIVSMPLAAMAAAPRFNLTTTRWIRKAASVYWIIATTAVIGFYILDFGHYAYLATRVDSTVLRFLSNAEISAQMVWESYPVVWIAAAWVAIVVIVGKLAAKLAERTLVTESARVPRWKAAVAIVASMFIVAGLMMGRYSAVPLRWSHAYFSGDSRMAALGLNPVLYYYDTFAALESNYDEAAVRQYYPLIANYLGVTRHDAENLNYDRHVGIQPHAVVTGSETPPNIIFIMLEGLGASRVGIYGNPLQPTPVLDSMAREGVWADHFYVPFSGTARTVFGSITGIADISKVTSSRNPLITDQRVILNSFTDYDKYYFIGGSAGWANMSAFIHQSIPDIQLFEENYYSESAVDVWGISDLSLFREFSRFMADRTGDAPFVAVLQTAANHRPFTIPEDNDGFETIELDLPTLNQWGFKSNEQFNAVRFLDFNIGRLLDMAKAGGFYEDSIFILYGDHNNRITATPHMPAFHTRVQLDLDGLHVPFIIHAPKHLAPGRLEEACSLLDVMPTAAGLAGIPYLNTTMGRDVFSPAPEGERAVYVQTKYGSQRATGIITRNFALRMLEDGTERTLHALHGETPERDVKLEYPEEFEVLRALLKGYFETTRFQFHHNRRSSAADRARTGARSSS